MPLTIAIIGAGPAGCMLARLLPHSKQADNIDVKIFEIEASINYRSQGGSLDLHVKTGQAALKAGGLFDDFLQYARYDGEAMKMADKDLLCYISQGQGKPGKFSTGRPEIDRPILRQLLYESLRPGTVLWNHKLTHIDDDHKIHFADGSTASGFYLIVGADGAWSHARPLLSSVKPFYSGIAGHAFTISDAEKRVPELYALVNRGNLFCWSDGKSIMAQQMGDGSLSVATWCVRGERWQEECEYDVNSPSEVKEACRREFKDWDPRLVAFTQEADDQITPRDLFMLPIGHLWAHRQGVPMIGDAAHVMTPFAGEGVNLALADALKLSTAIISAAATTTSTPSPATLLDEKVAIFEQEMFAYATKTQQMTYDMMNAMYFVPGAPRNGIEKYILTAVEDEFGRWATRVFATPLVYLWFFVFKMIW